MAKIIKTVCWQSCGKEFIRECQKTFGPLRGSEPKNFGQLLSVYPCSRTKAFQELFDGLVRREAYPDVSQEAISVENSCLFCAEAGSATALEIVLEHLNSLNQKGYIPSVWCYLDEERKAVVHFICSSGVYAELFCTSKKKEGSVLHMIETPYGYEFIPVCFVKDLAPFAHQADLRGAFKLREYLPRERFSLLSRSRACSISPPAPDSTIQRQRIADNGDNL